MKEMSGSGIFASNGEGDESELDNKTGLRMYQVSYTISQCRKCTKLTITLFDSL